MARQRIVIAQWHERHGVSALSAEVAAKSDSSHKFSSLPSHLPRLNRIRSRDTLRVQVLKQSAIDFAYEEGEREEASGQDSA